MKYLVLLISVWLLSTASHGQNFTLDLSGEWQVWLDSTNTNYDDFDFSRNRKQTIQLPSTLDEAGIGTVNTEVDYGRLSRKYKYYGAAWYQKEISIPQNWDNKNIELFLERVMWKSELWVDGRFVGSAESLGTPHLFKIGNLKEGKHILSLKINNDMIYNIGDCGHTYTEWTQTKWNGVLGRLDLNAFDYLKIENLQTFPELAKNQVEVQFELSNEFESSTDVNVGLKLADKSTGETVIEKEIVIKVQKEDSQVNQAIVMELTKTIKGWSEFNPDLYELTLQVTQGNLNDKKVANIGFRDISISKTKIIVNKKPAFMRGNLNNAEFPYTGYPSTNIEEWERIFKIHKSYGLNHVRFHSWCPPEAAFIAADNVGVYIQVETLWIAQWMRIEGRAFTPARPLPLGEDPLVCKYIEEELNRIIAMYGNHPSFVFFCVGNELDNGDYTIIQKWLDKIKIKDADRRLYSISASWDHAWKDQYKVTGEPYNRFFRKVLESEKKDLGYPRFVKAPHSNWDYEELDSQSPVPLIAHEIGQQVMYPLWSEIEKYEGGNLEPRNYIQFKEGAIKSGVYELNKEMSYASGKLAQLFYKNEIEGMLRTPSCAGFELLGMHDFPGQGEALVGWLDAFFDSKGVTTPGEFRQHCDTTVVLMRTNNFVYSGNETLNAKVQVHHFGTSDFDAEIYWKINANDELISEGSFESKPILQGKITDMDSINFSCKAISKASKITLEIGIKNSEIINTWDFWVYPEITEKENFDNVFITSAFDAECKAKLKKGAKVILVANELGNKASKVEVNFSPLYWSLTWAPYQSNKTLGTYVRSGHPALNGFPSDTYIGAQWETISETAMSFFLDTLPKSYQPIVQPIYDFHEAHKVGSIFECKIGKGKLLVCGYDILDDEKPVANQLKASLVAYVQSSQFKPESKFSEEIFTEMFRVELNNKSK